MSRTVVAACSALVLLCLASRGGAQEPPPDAAAAAAAAAERLKIALEAANARERVTREELASLLDATNRRDFEAVAGYFSDDAVLDMPRGPDPWGFRVSGAAGIREALAGWFDTVPDAQFTEARHVVAGDRGFSEWTLTGTSRDGQVVAVRGCDLFEFSGNWIVRRDTYLKLVDSPTD